MIISEEGWTQFIEKLRKVNDQATNKVREYIKKYGFPNTREEINALIDYAFAIATMYGEAAAELAAEMYEAIATASEVVVPSAVPAVTPTIGEVAKNIVGTLKSGNEEIVSSSIGRLVKQTGVDTTMQNALRDGAQWAWIPHGETCAFCIALASRGWQRATKTAIKNGHAEHIHPNCDCTYAVRFDPWTQVEGYNPREYRDMYDNAAEGNSHEKINAMRREFYQQNKDEINAQKRDAYEKRKERESSAAEELDV